MLAVGRVQCQILGAVRLQFKICTTKIMSNFLVIKQFGCSCILVTEFLNFIGSRVNFVVETLTFDNLAEKPPSQTPLSDSNWITPASTRVNNRN